MAKATIGTHFSFTGTDPVVMIEMPAFAALQDLLPKRFYGKIDTIYADV